MRIYDGKYESVTTILGIFNRYGGISRHVLARKAAIGREVHAICALINKGITWLPRIPDSVRPYVEQYRICKKHYIGEIAIINDVQMVERPLVHRHFRYGGTMDLMAHVKGIDGLPTLVSIKTTAEIDIIAAIQEVAYQELASHNKIKAAEDAYLIHLMPERYEFLNIWEYFEIDRMEALQAWHYCLWLYRFLKRKEGPK